jgi:CheY-like chemotaxis protein
MISQKILIAHQKGGFADLCKSWLEAEGYEVVVASDRTRALEIVDESSFDLALVSNSFPEVGGLKFLRTLQERGWDAPVILFSEQSFLPVHVVSEAVQLNVADVIEKPERPADLLESVKASSTQLSIGGVRGNLRTLGLPSLISILCNEGCKASLKIWHDGRSATIYFDKGNIVHALLDKKKGEEAVFDALNWQGGRFAMFAGRPAPERTIYTSWTCLVLEGLRRIDEEAFDQEQLPISEQFESSLPEQVAFELAPAEEIKRPPVFDLDADTQQEIEVRLARLYRDLTPRCVLLTNRSGRLLHLRGDIERSQALSLAALVAGSFSATSEIAEIVARNGERKQFRQSLQEGIDFDLYSSQSGEQWILAVTFEPERTTLGLARQLTLRAAMDLSDVHSQMIERTAQAAGAAKEVGDMMDDLFRQEVGDAIEDLFA